MENNREIAQIFYEMAIYLSMDNSASPFRRVAYDKASGVLSELSEDVEDILTDGGEKALIALPGIGKNMADKIVEYIKKGKIKEYEELKKATPVDVMSLIAIEGIGPKAVKTLYKELGVKTIKDLEKVAKAGKIRELDGFGEKKEQNILQGIEFLRKESGQMPIGFILPKAERIKAKLEKIDGVKKISFAGSLRRRKETISDVDILIAVENGKSKDSDKIKNKIMDYFVSLPYVEKVWGKGKTKSSVRMKQGFDIDLRIVPEESFGSALQYFTGSKEHNIATRKIAISKGYKLNEYGLYEQVKSEKPKVKSKKKEIQDKSLIRNSKIIVEKDGDWVKIAGEDEKGIYEKLGMDFVEPEMRENKGEIELASQMLGKNQEKIPQQSQSKLPKLITQKDIKGDLHCHSHWNLNHGEGIKSLVEKAISLGYEYVGITDHTKTLHIEHGLNEKELMEENEFIKNLNIENSLKIKNLKFKILHGCEANIMADGSIDIDDEVLAKLDFVIAGFHSQLKMPRELAMKRIEKAMRNPNVDTISHPTNRLILGREGSDFDFNEVLRIAKETGTILEINASPSRLDLNDVNIKKAKGIGARMVINTDAHSTEQMDYMKFGVSIARRGWAEKSDIINALSVEGFLMGLK